MSQDALQGQSTKEDISSNKILEIGLGAAGMRVGGKASCGAHHLDTDAVTGG